MFRIPGDMLQVSIGPLAQLVEQLTLNQLFVFLVCRRGMRFLHYLLSHENQSYAQLQPSNGAVCLVVMGQRSNFIYVATVVLLSGSSRGMPHSV